MSRKSQTCSGKKTGKPVTEYDTESDALKGATFAFERYGNKMVPYQCPTCNYWHLSPQKDDNTHTYKKQQTSKGPTNIPKSRKSRTCFGKKTGEPVTEYDTEAAAQNAATYSFERYGNEMTPYQCPTCNFWHLSPKSRQESDSSRQQYQPAKKSTSCFGQTNRAPLTEYRSKEEAKAGASHAAERLGNADLVPYRCDKCSFWHLSPKDRQTPSASSNLICDCIDSSGAYKQAYGSKEDCQRRADILLQEKGVRLKVFKCSKGLWHLSSDLNTKSMATLGRKSSTCRGKSSGTAVLEYDSIEEAQEAAEVAYERYGNSMTAYQCGTCQKWHLAPSK